MDYHDLAFKVGHVLIQVDDIEEAILRYRARGFTVTPGGLPGKTYNALIYFKDGSFLELFSTERGPLVRMLLKAALKLMRLVDKPYANRLARYFPGGKGLRDYALDSVPADRHKENVRRVQANGLRVGRERPKARRDHRGVKQRWTLCPLESIQLPFLMSGYSPPLTIEEADATHQNGAQGISGLHIATCCWEKASEEYSLLLGATPEVSGDRSGRVCFFSIGQAYLRLAEGREDGIDRVVLRIEEQHACAGGYDEPPAFIGLGD